MPSEIFFLVCSVAYIKCFVDEVVQKMYCEYSKCHGYIDVKCWLELLYNTQQSGKLIDWIKLYAPEYLDEFVKIK